MLDLLCGKSSPQLDCCRFSSRSGPDCLVGNESRFRESAVSYWAKDGYRSNIRLTVSLLIATFCDLFPSDGLSDIWTPRVLWNRKSLLCPQPNG